MKVFYPALPLALTAVLLSGCDSSDDDTDAPTESNTLPSFIVGGVQSTEYDGNSDDLLTAGLGASGLSVAAPGYADPAAPTAVELRRNAIHTNYRALVDYTAEGGFGTFYGPNVDSDGSPLANDGKIAGTETIALADDGTGRENVVLMVQVPTSFDAAEPCIVTATSSGSRGIYGAIGTAGEWGLKRGCAVAYTDKGTGNGLHDQRSDAVLLVDGTLSTAALAGTDAHFATALSDAEREAFIDTYPEHVAYKHAHSEQNPEKDWGRDTLRAVEFAFYVLNERFGEPVDGQPEERARTIVPSNTRVIASSVSNGGGAALAAAEQDTTGLIDGVAVAEPNVNLQASAVDALQIEQGGNAVTTIGRPLIDYLTYANLYQPCAALSDRAGLSLAEVLWPPAFTTSAENRCAALAARGLLDGATLEEQADAALDALHDYGWTDDSDFLHQSHFRFATNAVVLTYVNAYGRFSVADEVCGYGFADIDAAGDVVPQDPALQAGLFASGNGVPPTTGIDIVYDESAGGPALDFLGVSPSNGIADFSLDGAICLRELVSGTDIDTDEPLDGTAGDRSARVRTGIAEVELAARLQGTPAIIVAGRSDALIPVNHAARAYYGANLLADGDSSALRYYEVTNAQHFDAFIALGALLGYDSRFVPLHVYFTQAMDLMWEHLETGAPLPPSQVVRTTARAAGATLAPENVPAIAATPAAADLVSFADGTLDVPD